MQGPRLEGHYSMIFARTDFARSPAVWDADSLSARVAHDNLFRLYRPRRVMAGGEVIQDCRPGARHCTCVSCRRRPCLPSLPQPDDLLQAE